MPGARYTNQCSYSTPGVGRLGVFAPSRLCVENGCRKNAYIMRTKCAQKRECNFFTRLNSITYNFNALKCTHFHSVSALRHSHFVTTRRKPELSGNAQAPALDPRPSTLGTSLVLGYWNLRVPSSPLTARQLFLNVNHTNRR